MLTLGEKRVVTELLEACGIVEEAKDAADEGPNTEADLRRILAYVKEVQAAVAQAVEIQSKALEYLRERGKDHG